MVASANQAALAESNSRMLAFPAWATRIPVAGLCTCAVLYFAASEIYPKGSFDAADAGYRHLSNYWCDLLRVASPTGEHNPARPVAMLATWLLPVSLIPFWLAVPVLFKQPRWAGPLVQVAGTVAMVGVALVWTPWHDQVINLAAAFGFSATATTLFCVDGRRYRGTVVAACVASVLAATTYALWATKLCPSVIPAVQKAALLAVFGWVGLGCSAIRRELQVACGD